MKKTKKIKIGIPRGLLYHKYSLMWKSFFEFLGAEAIESPPTNKEIQTRGLLISTDETCLPHKIFLGHVDYLKDKVDFVFIPRIASLNKKEYLCDKFIATCDIVRNIYPHLKTLELNIDVNNRQSEPKAFLKTGLKLSKNPFKVIKAYKNAKKLQKLHDEKEIRAQAKKFKNENKGLKILIVSHPYNIYDELLGTSIISFLRSQKITILFSDLLNRQKASKMSEKISKDLY